MAEPNKGLHAELFGEDDSDDDFQEQQEQQDDAEAVPGQEDIGEQPSEAQEDVAEEFADEAAQPAVTGQEEYAPEDYEPDDQWLQTNQAHDEAQEVGVDEEDELEAMFKPKKKRKQERDISEKKSIVESILARMEVAAELDIEANQHRKPAIHKLQLLPEVEEVLVQRDLHDEFLDGGVLGVFKAWLEPMPDGSLPNAKVRGAVLRLLLQLNFFFEDRKEQLKKSGLGHVIMFLAKLPDELAANRAMARNLVEKWSRPIFEQYRNERRDEEAAEREADELRRQQLREKKELQQQQQQQQAEETNRPLRPSEKGFRFSAAVPEKAKLDYKRQPVSAIAADAGAGGRGKSAAGRPDRMIKKLADISKRSKQSGKAAKVSVEGRGLVVNSS